MNVLAETYKHILTVQQYMNICIKHLITKTTQHDLSKLKTPEVEVFEEYTHQLANITYASDEYKALAKLMAPAISHHYTKNRHHVEFHKNGISGMNLLDLVEMICDWKAATLRHNDGDIIKSLEINSKKYGYSDELYSILKNTIIDMGFNK